MRINNFDYFVLVLCGIGFGSVFPFLADISTPILFIWSIITLYQFSKAKRRDRDE